MLGVFEARVRTMIRRRGRARARQVGVLRQPRHLELGQAVLARAEELARAAQLQVDLGELEAVALVRRSPRAAAALGSPKRMQSDGVLAAADPAAQLVQLRQPEALGLLDQHHRRVRHVDADLDHARRHQHVGLAGGERAIASSFCSTASARGSARPAGRANSVVRSRSASAVAALAWSASDSSTSGQTTKHWRPARDLLADALVRARRARAPSTT